jgi:recombination protein RecA
MHGRDPGRDKAIDLALGAIEKQFGKGAIMRLIPTGSLGLDIALGIGGYPRGRIIEIYGPESSGKTTLTLHVVAEAQKRGRRVRLHRRRARARRRLRQEARREDRRAPGLAARHGEQALEIADMLVRSNAVDVVVIDSVAALCPRPRSRARWATATSACRRAS